MQSFAKYYNEVEKRAKADVPGSELLEQSTLEEPSMNHIGSILTSARDRSSEKKYG